jgi:hypothetical protein
MQEAVTPTLVRAASIVGWLALCGCFSEYHPEYHPETSFSVVQHVEYSTSVTPTAPPEAHAVPTPRRPAPDPAPAAALAPPGPASLSGTWIERIAGTTCDRQITIEEVDALPYASVRACDGDDGRFELRTIGYADGVLRARRADDNHGYADALDYQLQRVGADELRGTVVLRHERARKKPVTYPVQWTRGVPRVPSASGPYASLLGHWSQDIDEVDPDGQRESDYVRYCVDQLAIEQDASGLHVYGHGCHAESHFDNYVLTLVGDEEGTLRFRSESWDYGVSDYLLRRVDGDLRGVEIFHPSNARKGLKPSQRGLRWRRDATRT